MKKIKNLFFIGIANAKHLLASVLSLIIKANCRHYFKASDMKPRDKFGMIKWKCSKCNKIFSATYGLKILENGDCDGKWNYKT